MNYKVNNNNIKDIIVIKAVHQKYMKTIIKCKIKPYIKILVKKNNNRGL